MKDICGAHVTLKLLHDKTNEAVVERYFSFGEYDEDTETDSFGISDMDIYFYAQSVEELEELKQRHDHSEFVILDYELVGLGEVTI